MEFKKCRLCRSKTGSLMYIFGVSGMQSNAVAELISDILHIEVIRSDNYPPFVCRPCHHTLTEFKTFKERCMTSKKAFDKEFIEREHEVLKLRGPLSSCDEPLESDKDESFNQGPIKVNCGPISVKEELGIFNTDSIDQQASDNGPIAEQVGAQVEISNASGDLLVLQPQEEFIVLDVPHNVQVSGPIGAQSESTEIPDHQLILKSSKEKSREELIVPDKIGNIDVIEETIKKEPFSCEGNTETPKETSLQETSVNVKQEQLGSLSKLLLALQSSDYVPQEELIVPDMPDAEQTSGLIGSHSENVKATDSRSVLKSNGKISREELIVPDTISNICAIEETIKREPFSCERITESEKRISLEDEPSNEQVMVHSGSKRDKLKAADNQSALRSTIIESCEELIVPDKISNVQGIAETLKKEPISRERKTETPKETSLQDTSCDGESLEDFDAWPGSPNASISSSGRDSPQEELFVPDKQNHSNATENPLREHSFSCEKKTEAQKKTPFEDQKGHSDVTEKPLKTYLFSSATKTELPKKTTFEVMQNEGDACMASLKCRTPVVELNMFKSLKWQQNLRKKVDEMRMAYLSKEMVADDAAEVVERMEGNVEEDDDDVIVLEDEETSDSGGMSENVGARKEIPNTSGVKLIIKPSGDKPKDELIDSKLSDSGQMSENVGARKESPNTSGVKLVLIPNGDKPKDELIDTKPSSSGRTSEVAGALRESPNTSGVKSILKPSVDKPKDELIKQGGSAGGPMLENVGAKKESPSASGGKSILKSSVDKPRDEIKFPGASSDGQVSGDMGAQRGSVNAAHPQSILKPIVNKPKEKKLFLTKTGIGQVTGHVGAETAVPNASHGVLVMQSSGNKSQKKFIVPMQILNQILQKASCSTSAPNVEGTAPSADGGKKLVSKRGLQTTMHHHYKLDDSNSEGSKDSSYDDYTDDDFVAKQPKPHESTFLNPKITGSIPTTLTALQKRDLRPRKHHDYKLGESIDEDFDFGDSSSEEYKPESSSSDEDPPIDLMPKQPTPRRSSFQHQKTTGSIPPKLITIQNESSESKRHQYAVHLPKSNNPMPPKSTPKHPKLTESSAQQSTLQQPILLVKKKNSQESDTDEYLSESSESDEGNSDESGMRDRKKRRIKLSTEETKRPCKKPHSGANNEDEENYLCDLCGKNFYCYTSISNHLQNAHSDNKPFQCEICGKAFKSKHHLDQHLKMHSDARPFSCEKCGKSFRFRHHLDNHQLVHSGLKKYECVHCDKGFNRKVDYEKHQPLHDGKKVWECGDCPETFERWKEVVEHREKHRKAKNLMCDICSKKFRNMGKLRNHIFLHTRPFQCETCGKGFQSAVNLNLHKWTHSAVKPFPCALCEKRFNEKRSLSEHMRLHTGERPYPCLACGKRFTTKDVLSRHMIVHTGKMRFKCEECGKRFLRAGGLRQHVDTNHSKEERLRCDQCGTYFAGMKKLEEHRKRKHPILKENPFQCEYCGLNLSGKKNLLIHKKRRHPEMEQK